ncbi:MAG TPA: site-specific integrase [Bdellovibrionales bacterium]|nr:site-specific integrase [Bdellovibrionales bacterium]
MSKIEKSVPRSPGIYRIFNVDADGRQTPDGSYRVRKRVQIGGRWTTRSSTFDSLDEAKACQRQTHEDVCSGTESPVTFAQLQERFLHFKEHEECLAPGTIHGYRSRARHLRFFADYEVRQITAQVVDGWVNLLLDPAYKALQSTSRRDYEHELTLLTAILRYHREFCDETYLVPILARHRKRLCPKRREPEEIRFLSVQEEAAFLDALKTRPLFHDLALFQLHTGARIGEAAAMEFHAVDFSSGFAILRQHLHWDRSKGGPIVPLPGTKGGPERRVDLTATCTQMLRERRRLSPGRLVFADAKTGTWLAYRSIQHVYGSALKQLGLPHRGTHVLRHTFAVRFLDQTKDIHALQKLMGHKDLEQTQVYAKYSSSSVTRSFQLFRGGKEENHELVPQLVPRPHGS